jgi:hypothetical protein
MALSDRDLLVRTLQTLETAKCCDFFACRGPEAKPVPMASCTQCWAIWDLRNYLERHGAWCSSIAKSLINAMATMRGSAAIASCAAPTRAPVISATAGPIVRDKRGKRVGWDIAK